MSTSPSPPENAVGASLAPEADPGAVARVVTPPLPLPPGRAIVTTGNGDDGRDDLGVHGLAIVRRGILTGAPGALRPFVLRSRADMLGERDFVGHDDARRGCTILMICASSDDDEFIMIGDEPSDDTPTGPAHAMAREESDALTEVDDTMSSEESAISKTR